MIELTLLGLAYLAGADVWRLILLGVAVAAPLVLLPLIVVLVVRGRGALDDRAPLFCDSVASELRSGSSLAASLTSAGISVGLWDGQPVPSGVTSARAVAEAASHELAGIAAELAATVEAAARAGGRAADLFDELGALAIAQSEIAREVRVSSAPARATAWFFLVAPTAFVTLQARSGSLDALVHVPEQRIAVVAGMSLFLLGLGGVVFLLWRAG